MTHNFKKTRKTVLVGILLSLLLTISSFDGFVGVARAKEAPVEIESALNAQSNGDGITIEAGDYSGFEANELPFLVNECENMKPEWLFCDDFEKDLGEGPVDGGPNIIVQEDFESYETITDLTTGSRWSAASRISIDPVGGVDGSQAARIDIVGEANYPLQVKVPDLNLTETYVKFDFLVDSNASGGSKFLKIFGKWVKPPGYSNSGYANHTFILKYHSNTLNDVQYGSGRDGIVNDSNNYIGYNGNHNDPDVVVNYANGEIFDPKDGNWHTFEAYVKYNSDGLRDGEIRVAIDGEPYLYATNVENRHPLNSNEIESIRLGDYTSGQADPEVPWSLWYDNVLMMDGIPQEFIELFEPYDEMEDPEELDRSSLLVAIGNAQSRHDDAVEGNKLGQYEVGAKAALQSAIASAQAVYDNNAATQEQIDQAVTAMNMTLDDFATHFITLVEGASQVTIADLSIALMYFGTTDQDGNWNEIAPADLIDNGEITTEVLAAIAQMILDEWLLE